MKFELRLEGNGLDAMSNLATAFPKEAKKQAVIVANKTAKFHRTQIGRSIRQELTLSKKAVEREIKITKLAKFGSTIEARLLVDKNSRPPLKEFKARQTKKGVSYKISKKGGRKKIHDAFIVDRFGGNVYRRKGKARLPIVTLSGASVAGVYTKQGLLKLSQKQIRERVEYEAGRRMRALTVRLIRKQGKIDGLSKDQINNQIKALLG